MTSEIFVVTEYCVWYFSQFMEKGKQFKLSRQGVRGVKLRAKEEGVAQRKTSTPEIDRTIQALKFKKFISISKQPSQVFHCKTRKNANNKFKFTQHVFVFAK